MNEFIQICMEMVLQVSPIVVVLVVLGYIGKIQKRRGEEREEEKKKGRIRTKYAVKTEKIMIIIFLVGIIFSGGCTIASAIAGETWVPIMFGIAFIGFLLGSVNMIMWKLEVNGDEITWCSTFGKKRIFYFEDITYCERRKGSIRVYINGKKMFTINSNIDSKEFVEDVKRRRIPVRSYYVNQIKKNMKKR